MSYIMLTGGAYANSSLIAAAQRCLNLYPEQIPQQEEETSRYIHNTTPGLTLLSNAPFNIIRCLYTATTGDLYAVAGNHAYYIYPNWVWQDLGALTPSFHSDAAVRFTPISMTDSGISVLIADGSADGWIIDMRTKILTRIQSVTTVITGSVSNPNLVPVSTLLIDGTTVTIPASHTTAALIVNDINSASIANITASVSTNGALVITDNSGANILIGVGSANAALGLPIGYQPSVVSGTISNPNVIAVSTVYIDSVVVTIPSYLTSVPYYADSINTAGIPNIQASYTPDNRLTITDLTGADITIGDGSANAGLGLTQGITSTGGWYGADRVDYSDTYFIANKPGTPIFYVSGSESTAFDPTQFASKVSKGDTLVSLMVVHKLIWLFGLYSTEVFYDSGGGASIGGAVNTFPFEALSGVFFPRGIAAKYSLAQIDNKVYWLSQDLTGRGVVLEGDYTNVQRVSNHAIETVFSNYSILSDAIAFTYKDNGHSFYVLNFPTGDQTWVYDLTTGLWHERCWLDSNGKEHRIRANSATYAYNTIVCGDWENSNLYKLDQNNYTDNGMPIKRLRSFPHQIDPQGNRRIIFKQLIANMQVGTGGAGATTQNVINDNFSSLNNFTNINGMGQATQNGFIGKGGSTEYYVDNIPLSADYNVKFVATPTSYSTPAASTLYAIGRSNTSQNGYKASVICNGAMYALSLTVMSLIPTTTTVNLGVLSSGSYTINLIMNSTSIEVTAYRSDGLWLTNNSTWQVSTAVAIAINDNNFLSPGRIIIGGTW